MQARLLQQIDASITTKQTIRQTLIPAIEEAALCMIAALEAGRKILSCGNGGSANDAQHFATELVNRFERERPGLAALALNVDGSLLTAIGNDYHFEDVFAKQIFALGQEGDVLFAISTSGQSKNIIKAVDIAHQKGLKVVALTGRAGGRLKEVLSSEDKLIVVQSESTARIQEGHLLILHCLCDYIDTTLYPV